LSLIPKYNLGANNIRLITPRYKKEKKEIIVKSDIQQRKVVHPKLVSNSIGTPKNSKDSLTQIVEEERTIESKVQVIDGKLESKTPEKSDDFIYVNITETYERIAAKGYKSVELFKKLGDNYFLMGNHTNSCKWYRELYKMDHNQDAEFFYRYATSLRHIGQTDDADRVLELMSKKAGESVSSKHIQNKMFNMFRINAKH
jgi:tetratricopeptide (TPR) repeat protein